MYNSTQQQIDDREMFWISYYNSFKTGYNMTEGGNSNAARTSKTYHFFDGVNPIEITNLFKWCRENDIKYTKMKSLLYSDYYRESRREHGGYNNGL